MARLKIEAEAKASSKERESFVLDPKPNDLILGKVKFSERGMEAWTSVVYMHLDDSGLGVKSHSNLAMAGSCRNILRYSPILLAREVKYGLNLQSLLATEFFPT